MKLRGHHLLCIQGFRGYGYSLAFVANLRRLVDQLKEAPTTTVIPLETIGAICEPCPHRRQLACGRDPEAEERMACRDRRVLEKLGLQPGNPVAWQEVLERIRTKVEPEDLLEICAGCEWLSLGYCQEGIRSKILRTEDSPNSSKPGWEPGEPVSLGKEAGAAFNRL